MGRSGGRCPMRRSSHILRSNEQEKAVYNEQLKAYRNSPAYKRWLDAKQQGTCVEDGVISRVLSLLISFLPFFHLLIYASRSYSLPSLSPSLPSSFPSSLPSSPPLHSTAEQAAREAASLGLNTVSMVLLLRR